MVVIFESKNEGDAKAVEEFLIDNYRTYVGVTVSFPICVNARWPQQNQGTPPGQGTHFVYFAISKQKIVTN